MKSLLSGVTMMQNRIVAISFSPVLCLVQWDGKTTYLTALRDFYSLILALFEGMAACRIYWSLCLTEKQKLSEPLTGCGWCKCPQHASCKTQHLPEMWEQLPSRAELALSVLPSLWTKVYRVWADFPCLLHTHLKHWCKWQWLPFPTDTAEQNLSVLWAVALSPRASVSCVAYWVLDGCN